jgi:hypothetical protein
MHKIAAAEHRSTGHIPAKTGSDGSRQIQTQFERRAGSININPLNTELNPICYLLALLGAHHFIHVSRIRVK